ncbi:AraC family transcriptional regulator [Flavobacterium anhuiense]|uniref:AraC family transcriptional regulator n=1 Tax=Flavobacterium anhuiense TaxID=459526 RepID=UPI0011842FA3|nr:AraC family transcriptional regulator [Flavobacterium anhuiense]
MKPNSVLLSLLFFSQLVISQRNSFPIPDSLKNKSYKYLDERIEELESDDSKTAVYLYTYLQKAKREENWNEIVNGYQNFMHAAPEKFRSKYADSIVYAAKKTGDNTIIGASYLTKGIVYYSLKRHNQALDNYIIANNYISRIDDDYLTYKLKYHIALVKYYLGYYDEAISLLNQCVTYFKKDASQPYLNSLHSLGLCYNRQGNYGHVTEINTLGLQECKNLGIQKLEVYFIHSEGINEYYKKDYASSIKKIQSSIEDLKNKKDFGNEAVGYFYIGKDYWALGKFEMAIPYFKKVDYLFNTKGYIRPDLREMYELLINYYKTKDNPKLQLYYIDQLLKADRVLNETFKYLVGKINKEYQTQELLLEKEKIQKQLDKKNSNYSVLVGFTSFLFLSFLFLTFRYYRNRKLYKKNYDELMHKSHITEQTYKPRQRNEKPAILDINPETIALILKQMEKFEKEKKFLDKDMNLSKLSTSFNSNPRYLSNIIRHYRDKVFTEYINDLRIDYVIELLQSDKKARLFTNKALAEEAGFSSTQLFVNIFKAKTGMPTAFFIEQIKKENH